MLLVEHILSLFSLLLEITFPILQATFEYCKLALRYDITQQAVFKLYLQDGREYLWQCSNKKERDLWAMSVSASVRSQGFIVQVLVSII